MTKGILTAALAAAISTTAFSQASLIRPVHIGLIYPISTNGIYAGDFTNYCSIHALAGLSQSEKAFAAAGIANIVKQDAGGLIAAGFSNHIGGDAHGLQAAGFMNTVRHQSTGLQAAGFLNATRHMKGAQMAGFANVTSKSEGFQAAGFTNVSGDAGVQAAGFANVARDVSGTQVAGFINVARKVDGVQLSGFMNVAESSDYPIGLVNIIKNGDIAIGITTDESLTTLLALRSGGRVLYGVLGVGWNNQDPDFRLRRRKLLYALEGGLGAHLAISRHFRINFEGASTSLTNFQDGVHLRSSLRVLPAVTLGRQVELFAGPTFNHVWSNNGAGQDLIDYYLWSDTRRGYFNGFYFGAVGGLQIRL